MSQPTESKPSAIMLLRNADANLEILHLRPETIQPLRITDMRQCRELLERLANRIADLREDLQGNF